jgi:hypothetical protein
MQKILIYIAAILVAGCAAFFSVTGLGNLFKSFSVMVMAGSLEYAKLVTAAYLKSRWEDISKAVRIYLSTAVVILMLITSMGIYGYLSDAYQKQGLRIEQADRQVSLLQDKIQINKDEIERYSKQNEKMLSIRNSQEENISKLITDKRSTGRMTNMIKVADQQITINSKKIDSLNSLNVLLLNDVQNVKNNNIDLEKEIGGFRFIAESFNVSLNTAVKWFILIIVFVFDPLAIALVLALNNTKKMEEQQVIYDKDWIVNMRELEFDNEYAYVKYILETIGDGKYGVIIGSNETYSYSGLIIDTNNTSTIENAKKHKVFSGNIVALMKTYNCPRKFDLLNIDIDGTDYWVLKKILSHYKPKLIIAEFNPSVGHGVAVTIPDEFDFVWQNDTFYGFSFEAGKKLAQENEYTIVFQMNTKIFMVANEYLQNAEIPEVNYEQESLLPQSERKWFYI